MVIGQCCIATICPFALLQLLDTTQATGYGQLLRLLKSLSLEAFPSLAKAIEITTKLFLQTIQELYF
jgi:hypothetical protein